MTSGHIRRIAVRSSSPPAADDAERGLGARLDRLERRMAIPGTPSEAPVPAAAPAPQRRPERSPEPAQSIEPVAAEPEPVAAETEPEPAVDDPALDPERARLILDEALDTLGAAHHRPFSRG